MNNIPDRGLHEDISKLLKFSNSSQISIYSEHERCKYLDIERLDAKIITTWNNS